MKTESMAENLGQINERLDFTRGHGLDIDACNNWSTLSYVLENGDDWFLLKEPWFYEEYVRGTNSKEDADSIMALSDPAKIAKHDRVVSKFLESKNKIVKEKDLDLLRKFYDFAIKIISDEIK